MHFIDDKGVQRPDYIYDDHGVGYHKDARPYVKWDHIDGPLLICRDGQLHWLTWRERIWAWWTSAEAEAIEKRVRRPKP